MIRIDAVWMAAQPLDTRAGIETVAAGVIDVSGQASPHRAYVFANKRTPA